MSLIEAAKTGRSKCRACEKPIAKDALRFGEQLPSGYSDDEQTYWFHIECAAEKKPESLAFALKGYAKDFPGRAALEGGLAESARGIRLQRLACAELDPSGRASCKQCNGVIAKSTLRIGIFWDLEATKAPAGYLHIACVSSWVGLHEGLSERLKTFFQAIPNAKCPECTNVLSYVDPLTHNVAIGQLACAKCGGMFDLESVDSRKKPPKKEARPAAAPEADGDVRQTKKKKKR